MNLHAAIPVLTVMNFHHVIQQYRFKVRAEATLEVKLPLHGGGGS
jgi:hypothetical protein